MPRRSLLPIAGLLTATLTLSCADFASRGPGLARVVVQPRFSQQGADIFRSLRQFNLGVTTLKASLSRPQRSGVLVEKTITVEDTATQVEVSLDVTINGSEELLTATLEMFSGDVKIFFGSVNVLAKAGADPTAERPQLMLNWVGPGSEATSVKISPRDQNLSAINGRLLLTATAFTANQLVVENPDFLARFRWSVDDTTLGSIPLRGGEFVAKGKPGIAAVSVVTPNGLRDTIRLSLQSVLPLAQVSFARKVEVVDNGATAAPVPVSASDPNGTPVTTAVFSYESRNTQVAAVNASTGAITGVARGQTMIIVRAQEPGSTNFALDSLLAVIAEPGSPVVITSADRFSYARSTSVTISVFVDMRSTSRRLGSTTVDLDFSPLQLTYQGFTAPTAGLSPTVNTTLAPEGRLTLAMASVDGFPNRVELLRVTFLTSAGAASGNLTLTARELSAADFTDLLAVTTQVTHPLLVP